MRQEPRAHSDVANTTLSRTMHDIMDRTTSVPGLLYSGFISYNSGLQTGVMSQHNEASVREDVGCQGSAQSRVDVKTKCRPGGHN